MVSIYKQRFRLLEMELIAKNTYGQTVIFSQLKYGKVVTKEFTGSSLDRTKQIKKYKKKERKNSDEPKLRSMSVRTKRKIRKKITCFARLQKRLSFLTLTFVNEVSDQQAVNILRKFLDNAKKRSKNFQYIWIAERQLKNEVFNGNIHFHILTNKYWKIDKWWKYWVDLQAKNGITARDKDFKPSSAFDVKQINSNEIKRITSYVTKYVTKNESQFNCQVWNCSKGVSNLYTDFYTNPEFVKEFEKVKSVIKTKKFDECKVKYIDMNRRSIRLYSRLDDKNNTIYLNK